MDYDDLLARCESEIESHLLGALYPNLGPDAQKEIEAQHMIDYYDMPVTLPDFAFPYLRIAIYCDGYEYHWERDPFQKDRQQARALQLQGWLVLRFAGSEILNDTDAVAANAFSAICGTVWAGALLRVQNNSTPTSVTRSIHHNGLF